MDVGELQITISSDLLTIARKRILRWFGHVLRGGGLVNTILQGTVPGKRGRGGTTLENGQG